MRLHTLTGQLLIVLLAVAILPPAAGQQDPARWQEYSYGLSLLPPDDALYVTQTPDRALATFETSLVTLNVFLENFGRPLSLEALQEIAAQELSYATVEAWIDEEVNQTIADRPGLVVHMRAEADGEQELYVGQAIFLIDPTTAVVLQAQADARDAVAARELLLTMANNARLTDPIELDTQRDAMMAAGRDWLDSIDFATLRFDLAEESWYRVQRAGQDVGYLRVRELEDDASLGLAGYRVEVDTTLAQDGDRLRSQLQAFTTGDRQEEVWDLLRQQAARGSTPARNWEETGVRTGERLQVTLRHPDRVDEHDWVLPIDGAYLSQAERWLLLTRLPRRQTHMAFYSYDQPTQSLSLMTVRVVPQPGGRVWAFVRPALSQPEERWVFDRSGRLLERQLPDGRVLTPTTPDALRAVWGDGPLR